METNPSYSPARDAARLTGRHGQVICCRDEGRKLNLSIGQIFITKKLYLCIIVKKNPQCALNIFLCSAHLSVHAFVVLWVSESKILCLSGTASLHVWEECVPLLAAGKVFPIFSNWAHCLALQSPDCGSLFLHPPHRRNTFVEFRLCKCKYLSYGSLSDGLYKMKLKHGFWKSRYSEWEQ